jgi:flagellin
MRIERMAADLYRQHETRQKNLSKVQEKLATGKRINRASDDAAGLAVAQALDKFVRGYKVASENINAGISALQISDGGGSVVTDMLQRQRELALQSSNGTLNAEQRQALDREYQALSQEIERVAQSTEYNGQKLANGQGPLADGSGNIQAGGNASDRIPVPGGDLTLASLGVSSSGVDSPEGASQALRSIDEALRRLSENRVERGAFVNRLEHSDAVNWNQTVGGTQALSAILDLDYAQAMTDKVRESILSDAQTASMSQFDRIARSHLLALLGG